MNWIETRIYRCFIRVSILTITEEKEEKTKTESSTRHRLLNMQTTKNVENAAIEIEDRQAKNERIQHYNKNATILIIIIIMLLLDTLSIYHHKWMAINGARMENLSIRFSIFLYHFSLLLLSSLQFTNWTHSVDFGSNVYYASFIVPQQSARARTHSFICILLLDFRLISFFCFCLFICSFGFVHRSFVFITSIIMHTIHHTAYMVHSVASIERNCNHFRCKLRVLRAINVLEIQYTSDSNDNNNNEAKNENHCQSKNYSMRLISWWWINGTDTVFG